MQVAVKVFYGVALLAAMLYSVQAQMQQGDQKQQEQAHSAQAEAQWAGN